MDRLTQSFGRDRIFMDVDAIEPGLDFLDVINAKVTESFAFLVVIGPGWVNAAGLDGRRRLDNPDDLVRLEIEAGLKRDIRVIPVLVDGAPMPSSADLPSSLQSLVRRQSIRLTHDAFGSDAERLIATLSRLPDIAGDRAAAGRTELEFSPAQLLKLVDVVPAGERWFHKWPSIPPKKEKRARSAAYVPQDEEIALLIDMTTFGSAKNVFLFGRRGWYHRYWPTVASMTYKVLCEHRIGRRHPLLPAPIPMRVLPVVTVGRHVLRTGDVWVRERLFCLLHALQVRIKECM
jgi:hypothetical protein